MFISAAINKYIYVTMHRSDFDERIRVRYSKMEEVKELDQIQNEIVRETLRIQEIKDRIELTSHAEIPSGTGLGSSGAFGVGLCTVFGLDQVQAAKISSEVQMDVLKYPIGWQDQLATAFGGVRAYTIKDGTITNEEIHCPGFEEKLCLFYTGIKRDTNEVLKKSTTDGLDVVQKLAYRTRECLESGNYDEYGSILNEHWEAKKRRGGMTNPEVDKVYELALQNGALGGKIVGAGGGGFLLFYTNERDKLIANMPLKHVPFRFDHEGTKVIYRV